MEQQHQHGIDRQNADCHRRQESGEQLFEPLRIACLPALDPRGQMRKRGKYIDLGQHVAERAAAQVRGDRHVTAAVITLDALGPGAERHSRDVFQGNEPRTPRHEHGPYSFDVPSRGIVQTHADGYLAVRKVEFRETGRDVATRRDACRGAQGFRRNTQLRGAGRIRLNHDLRLYEAGRRSDVRQARAA